MAASTAIATESVRQSTRVPIKIPLTVVSLNPHMTFSEACNTVSVNAQGCAIYAEKSIAISTPVLLRLKNGKEATGQVAFCKGSPSNEKLWGIGVVLDQPGNFWGINPCPKDWLSAEGDAVAPPSAIPANQQGSKSAGAGITAADLETMRTELLEQLRREATAMFEKERVKLDEQIQSQNKNTALAEGLLQESVKIRESATALQSVEETIDQKLQDGTRHAIERMGANADSLMVKAQSDSEKFAQGFRKEVDEISERAHQSFSSSLEKAHSQLSDFVGGKKQEIPDAMSSIEGAGDRIHTIVLHRLENEFETQKQEVASAQAAITSEIACFRDEVESIDNRIVKARELSAELETILATRLDQKVSEAILQAQTKLQQILSELRNEQTAQARADMENMFVPISTRASSLIEELGKTADAVSRGHDETQIQIEALRQTREETQAWLSQQLPDFHRVVETALSDTATQAKTILMGAVKMIDDPLDKLSRETKNKIDEFATRQQSELDEGIRRLRSVLATLEQQAEESLRASFQTGGEEAPSEKQLNPQEQFEANIPPAAEKSIGRGQPSFAQKLSGLVRGREPK